MSRERTFVTWVLLLIAVATGAATDRFLWMFSWQHHLMALSTITAFSAAAYIGWTNGYRSWAFVFATLLVLAGHWWLFARLIALFYFAVSGFAP